jgi:hypothetical protein
MTPVAPARLGGPRGRVRDGLTMKAPFLSRIGAFFVVARRLSPCVALRASQL